MTLDNLLKQLHILMSTSPHVDEELLSLIFQENLEAKTPMPLQSLKREVTQYIVQQRDILSSSQQQLSQLSPIPHSEIQQLNNVDKLMSQMPLLLDAYQQTSQQLASDAEQCHQQQAALLNQHRDNLSHLYEDIDIHYELHGKLSELATALNDVNSLECLLNNVSGVISLLLKSIHNEKEHSKFFIRNIHREIDDLNIINQNADKLTQDSAKQRQHWDKTTQGNLTNLSLISQKLSLSTSDKQALTHELRHLTQAMIVKTQIDEETFTKQQQQIQQLSQKLAHIEQQAENYQSQLVEQRLINMQDSLTKLPNRKALEKKFGANFTMAKQSEQSLWVAVADIDHFKSINDNYGHSAGDKTLQVIAGSLSNALRDSEFIARYGGEEFVFLLPNLPQNAVNIVLNRVRERIKKIPFKFKNKKVQITISIGATRVKASDQDPKNSFDRADKALYQAKRQGRDRVIIY